MPLENVRQILASSLMLPSPHSIHEAPNHKCSPQEDKSIRYVLNYNFEEPPFPDPRQGLTGTATPPNRRWVHSVLLLTSPALGSSSPIVPTSCLQQLQALRSVYQEAKHATKGRILFVTCIYMASSTQHVNTYQEVISVCTTDELSRVCKTLCVHMGELLLHFQSPMQELEAQGGHMPQNFQNDQVRRDPWLTRSTRSALHLEDFLTEASIEFYLQSISGNNW